jgi:hypothetical protein
MNKISLIFVVRRIISQCVLISFSILILTGMGRHINKDLSDSPLYSQEIGKEYKTKDDYVLFTYSRRYKEIVISQFGRTVPTREEIKDKFPYKHKDYGHIILGVLPKGSVFRVNRVTEEGHSSATFFHYYAELLSSDNAEFIGKEINPTYLTNMSNPPQFLEKLVEEVTPVTQ